MPLSFHPLPVKSGVHSQRFLIDFDLDDGKGDDLVRWIRHSGNRSTIIGVSSHEEGNRALLNAGASGVCNKMHFDDIQTVIDALTTQRESS